MRNNHLPLSFAEHQEIARNLKEIQQMLGPISLVAFDAYGPKVADRVEAFIKAGRKLQSMLDDKLCGEYPMSVNAVEGVRLVDVYYGNANEPRSPNEGSTPSDARQKLRARLGIDAPEPLGPGRTAALSGEEVEKMRLLIAAGDRPIKDIATEFGISVSSVYRYLPHGRART